MQKNLDQIQGTQEDDKVRIQEFDVGSPMGCIHLFTVVLLDCVENVDILINQCKSDGILVCRQWSHASPTKSHQLQTLSLAGAEKEIFGERQVNTIAADDLATCVARSSAAMVLTL